MKARFLAPRVDESGTKYNGNLVWAKSDFESKEHEITSSLKRIRNKGYWASAFPEGDGVAFSLEDESSYKDSDEIFSDFRECFDWVSIEISGSRNSNLELAELEPERELKCIVIVPLESIFIQRTLSVGPFTFYCRREFDSEPYERLTNYSCEYLQFEVELKYKDLLRLNNTIAHNDYVISKCLSMAEHAMDLVRYVESSFIKKEFTPNPAGQMDKGLYCVDIIPIEKTHLKPFELKGISRPFSVANNWLGPQLDDFHSDGIEYLAAVHNGEIDNELSSAIIGALRSCRQSFYSLGSESQFLNLVFTLDGLTDPDWSGWQQRTYIAALLSNGCPEKFAKKLTRYDELYYDVRNKLVHEGADFYELSEDPDKASEDLYGYIKDIIELVAKENFINVTEMKAYAIQLLQSNEFINKYTQLITSISQSRNKHPRIPTW
ncbi:hypothetical protein [Shewanella frigidimarina]|uniref:hypothetical protein n=1 Tax=Shewanella frigidimarina TaxID=56812 RepID=UPI000F50B2D8|nr:hypothetical protein [Shewanella frigidimarina]RPA31947.1 hypothetical protein EGC78_09450 [Shewanella frigidimarina]